MKSAVILFPGSNREHDAARALKLVAGSNVNIVWHGESELPKHTDLVVLPGGFSYGDYLRCGAIAARANIMGAVRAHAEKGGLVLGICNGFQILCEAGLLPGVLVRNAKLRFVCREVFLRVERADTAFTRAYRKNELLRIPIAHGEGNYTADETTIKQLEAEGRVAFRYARADGQIDQADGPNGAINGIAGIYSEKLNVLGMMPHPENNIEAQIGRTDGRGLFESLAAALKAAA
ncbi:MAG: phosphoribosylformylglycinamidine synthase I [Rhizobiales bacterium 24-66-13]|jgi:phosphoribosylformylglycinamidine synthase|uniref:phosphoribosylformylglycinamidine synthase subunit PurQ n=1 Tax=Roseixanthobacter finlandensis TaxID=3119922 RepID=UPI000BDA7F0D|nr:MAG: phosphoribosylformylglycinamidine synthase I [Rhizobiales bacterium 32-66-11]OYZ79219.1 MAG: phosphoribosylformylglycinamidine synthase I [Rhizobiales bacterium 24-66-13]OZB04072.1 MAG: phosphoribosylformylglycinamidine synthase I [Rhizobiales bacterium 39-66-18]HQS10129.1 phosphoribosylformylglycinamidine synthase subunit PurQ [Xanthobacteraceae bacterium]HQS45553.1 phosphoribosylformylglycinamidine synthase subunit PurQ [Xanthobacteraceae bacterium]